MRSHRQKRTSGPGEVARPNDLTCIAIGSSSHTAKTVHNGRYRLSTVTQRKLQSVTGRASSLRRIAGSALRDCHAYIFGASCIPNRCNAVFEFSPGFLQPQPALRRARCGIVRPGAWIVRRSAAPELAPSRPGRGFPPGSRCVPSWRWLPASN